MGFHASDPAAFSLPGFSDAYPDDPSAGRQAAGAGPDPAHAAASPRQKPACFPQTHEV